jgi:hypothetical protein
MANSKISALTSATTPLAGTETLPIVQSSATVKVATDDLTVKNIRSNATTGILQIAGPATASTRIATVPDANWTAARTDAAQSFTGDQTLSTGNAVQGTAAKGFNFTANTPAAGMSSQLLNWYEEGTFTATLATGATTTPTATGHYTRVGRLLTVQLGAVFGSITSNGAAVTITTNLAFPAAQLVTFFATGYNRIAYNTAKILFWQIAASGTTFSLLESTASAATVTGVAIQAGTFNPSFDFITVTYRV